MRKYKFWIICLNIVLINGFCFAAEVVVDTTVIAIPQPQGFYEVDLQYKKTFYDYFNAESKDKDNKILRGFVDASDIALLMKGEMPLVKRWLNIQVSKALENKIINANEFEKIKTASKNELEKLKQYAEATTPGYSKKMEKFLSAYLNQSKVDVNFKIPDIVFLGVNEEHDNYMSYSILAKSKISSMQLSESFQYLSAVTSSLVLVKGKVLMSLAIAEYNNPTDLEWSKKAMNQWVKAILLKNTNGQKTGTSPPALMTSTTNNNPQGAQANISYQDSYTALIAASMKGDIERVKMLIEKGADVNEVNNNGRSALLFAINQGQILTAKMLIENGSNVNAADHKGETVLMESAYQGHPEIARILIAKGADVNTKDKKGVSALMMASMFGHTEIVKMLIKNGADVNAKDVKGFTALKSANIKGNIEIAKILINAGAKE